MTGVTHIWPGPGVATEVGFFLSDKSPITEKVFDQIGRSFQIHVATMYPILTKLVNTNIRHPLCISCPSRPRCRIQFRPLELELGWPEMQAHMEPEMQAHMEPEMQAYMEPESGWLD